MLAFQLITHRLAFIVSLCPLCVLCVSVVNYLSPTL
jgi:hypothetical protein